MKQTSPKGPSSVHSEGRRQFLRKATLAGSSAVAVAALPGIVAAEPEVDPAAAEPKAHDGYQETQHVRDYYRTAYS